MPRSTNRSRISTISPPASRTRTTTTTTSDSNPWDLVLRQLRNVLDDDEFRRWFGSTSYASDSGDVITVWVGTEPVRRHIITHYTDLLARALAAIDRADADIRFIAAGFDDEEDDDVER